MVYEFRQENQYQPEVVFDSVTQKIYTVTAYIHSNYTSELTLQGLSKQFFISPYYLSHQFKKVTGFTLINYIQMTRVRNAQQLLLYTQMKITDIASNCGFTSFSQFNRVFNRISGCSPSQYRTGKEGGH
jgi:AraC-like DNA-binding protein